MFKNIFALLGEAAKEWQQDNSFQRGAAIAFFATFSVAPILIIGISISGFFFGIEGVRDAALKRVEGFVGPDNIGFIADVMEKTFTPSDNIIAIIIGLLALLFGAAGVFFQIKESLQRMWQDYMKKEKLVEQIFGRFGVPIIFVFGTGLVFIVMSLFRTALTVLSKFLSEYVTFNLAIAYLVDYVFSIGITVLVFMIIYRLFSPVAFRWAYAFFGAVVSAALLQVGKIFIDYYIGFAGVSVIYGTAGSFAVLMTWIFFSALIFLYGAEVTKVLVMRNSKKNVRRR